MHSTVFFHISNYFVNGKLAFKY